MHGLFQAAYVGIRMTKTRLVEPTASLEGPFIDFMNDWKTTGEKRVPFFLDFDYSDFPKYVQTLKNYSQGIDIPEGFVPHSTYWLISEENRIIGVSNMRHTLTAKLLREGGNIGYGIRPSERKKGFATDLLRQTLLKAGELGLTKVLLTCDKLNTGSIGTILNNNGLFDSEEELDSRTVRRYWIHL